MDLSVVLHEVPSGALILQQPLEVSLCQHEIEMILAVALLEQVELPVEVG
jgi:hypothetical protein